MCPLRSVLSTSRFLTLDFRTEKKTREMTICHIMRCVRAMPLVKSQLGMVYNLLGAVSEKLDIVSQGGVGVDLLKMLDKFPSTKVGLLYPFSIQGLQI